MKTNLFTSQASTQKAKPSIYSGAGINWDVIEILPQPSVKELDTFDLYCAVNAAYHLYREENPPISDAAYDRLEKELVSRLPDAIQRIESDIPAGYREKTELPFKMPGLVQLYGEDDIEAWVEKNSAASYILSDKLDGISVSLIYLDGMFYQGFTKHTGSVGIDITRHLAQCPNFPKFLNPDVSDVSGKKVIRGEIIMPIATFKEKWADQFKNPRNMVGGQVGRKTTNVEAWQDINVVAYSSMSFNANNRESMHILMRDHGFECVVYNGFKPAQMNYDSLAAYTDDRRNNSKYELDGVVIEPSSVDNLESREADGMTVTYARKFKLDSEIATTTVVDVEWNISKDGFWKPRICIEPVELAGVTVTHASGFNGYFIANGYLMGTVDPETGEAPEPAPIGKGAVITIMRSGEVIPDVQEIIQPAKEPTLPEGDWEWNETGVDIQVGPDHPIAKLRTAIHFFGTVGVEEFSTGTITKFWDGGYDSIEKILHMSVDDMLEFDGVQARSAQKYFDNIRYALDGVHLPTLMAATNIFGRGYGVRRFTPMYEEYQDEILDWSGYTEDEIAEEVSEIAGIGEVFSYSFAKNVGAFREWLATVSDVVTVAEYENAQTSDSLEGWVFKLTGFRDSSVSDRIKAAGGKEGSPSSKNAETCIVVNGKPEKPSSSVKKAEALGAQVMSPDQFKAWLEEMGA